MYIPMENEKLFRPLNEQKLIPKYTDMGIPIESGII